MEVKVPSFHLDEAETTKDVERTMKKMQKVGNYPTKYEELKMPTLDLKIWDEDTETGCKIMHEHYSKPMSTPALLIQRSGVY